MLESLRAKEEKIKDQRHVLATLTGLEEQVGGWCVGRGRGGGGGHCACLSLRGSSPVVD